MCTVSCWKSSKMLVWVEPHLTRKQRFQIFAVSVDMSFNCWHSLLAPLLTPCISVFSFSLLLHSLFEALRLHANKRRCVCMVRPLIGQSWLSSLNRGSVGDEGLPWSPNISISPFTLQVLVQLQQSVLVTGRSLRHLFIAQRLMLG